MSEYSESIFPLAAKACNMHAEWRLATCYHLGHGVKKNEDTAFEWYQKAAEHGNVEAQYLVGSRFQTGDGIRGEPIKMALKWYKKGMSSQSYIENINTLNTTSPQPQTGATQKLRSLSGGCFMMVKLEL
jgi:TPR repeat protein